VPLDGWLVERMAAYLETHPRADDPTAPLFPNRRKGGAPGPRALDWDQPVEPGALYDSLFKKALAAVGLPTSAPATDDTPAVRGVRLHDLRHTFAVLSLSAGEHYMQVSRWLGHGNFSITLNVYGGYIPQDEGGKAAPLAAPIAPTAPAVEPATNVIWLASRRRSTG
jgi:integrase